MHDSLGGEGRCEANLRFWSLGRDPRAAWSYEVGEKPWRDKASSTMQKMGERLGKASSGRVPYQDGFLCKPPRIFNGFILLWVRWLLALQGAVVKRGSRTLDIHGLLLHPPIGDSGWGGSSTGHAVKSRV